MSDSSSSLDDDVNLKAYLKPKIGLFGGVSIIVGCIIGSGIFISPKGVYENIHSVGWSFVVWLACGAFVSLGALCYAELGTLIQESGSDYTYLLTAFGPLVGFLRVWLECFIFLPCGAVINSLLAATYLLQPFYPHDCTPPAEVKQLIAAVILIFICHINCVSVSLATALQKVLTVTKLLALGMIILTGLYLLIFGDTPSNSFHNAFVFNSQIDAAQIVFAFYSGFWAYGGWNGLNFITEEMVNPVRDLPRAIAISLGIVTLVYFLVNISFFAGLSREEFISSDAIAFTFANKYYGRFAFVVPILVAASCLGALNGSLLASSRLFFVAGRNGHLPTILSYVHPELHTPIPAVLSLTFMCLVYLPLSDNVYTIINYSLNIQWMAIAVLIIGLFVLRIKMPIDKYQRPFKVNLAIPTTFLIGCIILALVPIIQVPLKTGIGVCIALVGIPIYYLFVKNWIRIKFIDSFIENLTHFIERLFLVLPMERRPNEYDNDRSCSDVHYSNEKVYSALITEEEDSK